MTAATVMQNMQVARHTPTSTSGHVKTRRLIVVCSLCFVHMPAVELALTLENQSSSL